MYKMALRLAWKNIWKNRRRTFITGSAIGFGLSFCLIMISLGDGFYSKLIDDSVRMQAGYIVLEHPEYEQAPAVDLVLNNAEKHRKTTESISGVSSTRMFVFGQGVIRSSYDSAGIMIVGIEPSRDEATSIVAKNIKKGRFLKDNDKQGVVISKILAERLKVKLGKKLVVISNDINGEMVEELLRVKGVFETGAEELDSGVIQIPIKTARKIFGMKPSQATRLGIMLDNPDSKESILKEMRQKIKGNIAVKPWEEVLPELAAYIKSDRFMLLFFNGLLIFLVLFTIFNTILMSVLERENEFSIVLALGTPNSLLKSQVFFEGVFIAIIGCILGVIAGLAMHFPLQIYGLDMTDMLSKGASVSGFTIDMHLYGKLTFKVAAKTTALVFITSVLMALLPMRQINKVSLTERNY